MGKGLGIAGRSLAVVLVLTFAPMTASGAPDAGVAHAGTPACSARSGHARLEIDCPSATLAEFLTALQNATRLRSEYPRELAATRISITRRNASLLEVLEGALAAFNFAVWLEHDPRSPATVYVVHLRGSAAATDQPRQERASDEAPMPADATDESLEPSYPLAVPLTDDHEMARANEDFASTIEDADPLEPPSAADSSVLVPDQ
jgi:hypothetical protein